VSLQPSNILFITTKKQAKSGDKLFLVPRQIFIWFSKQNLDIERQQTHFRSGAKLY
jgi:hypothetical protein